MKRIIKFRAKDKKTGKWVYGDLTHSKGINAEAEKLIYDRVMVAGYEVEEETIGQLVWTNNRTGDLYEGDIIGFDDWAFSERQRKKMKHHIGVIKYHIEDAMYYIDCEDRWYKAYEVADPQLLGNIYDNPKMIKNMEEE